MAKKPLPTPDELRQLLRYEPESGKLTWMPRGAALFADGKRRSQEAAARIWNGKHAGKPAFTVSDGHALMGTLFGIKYKAHRVAWAIYNGAWPKGEIDHINGDATDNRIANLRVADRQENMRNTCVPRHNSSGFMGVGWHAPRSKWRASITVGGKSIHLGLFDKKSDAILARKQAERKHGFHRNHGRPHRTFRSDLEESLNTRTAKGAPA